MKSQKEKKSFVACRKKINLVMNGKACGAVVNALIFESEDSKFESHCSQHVVVSLGKTLHPKVLLWGLPTVLSM